MKTICRDCGVELTDENWNPSQQKNYDYICKSCNGKKRRQWRKANPEKVNARNRQWRKANPDKMKAIWTRRNRKLGQRPYNENKACPAYLGVYIAEGALSQAFENMKRMPMNNPGFDFMWQGYKIDAKSSCIVRHVVNGIDRSYWAFNIKCNTIPDYFLFLAFDNREDLNLLHLWLILGAKINHLEHTSISPCTIHKWDAYRLDITKMATCCNALR